jgi:hypothetical protein
MCISCGNCSTYWEMGIDVRPYAMTNEDVKRATCVGLRHVRPRLPAPSTQLENKPVRGKAGRPIRVYAVTAWSRASFQRSTSSSGF